MSSMLKCRKSKTNFIYKTIFSLILAGGSILLPAISYAQGGDLPCGGEDPTGSTPCPLDTWVWLLAAVAVVFGAMYLQRQQKLQKQA